MRFRLTVLAALVAGLPAGASPEPGDSAAWAARVSEEYAVYANLTYLTAGGVELKLDVYAPRESTTPNAVAVYYHGGGWAGGSREGAVLRILPYLEMGFTVVNVEYRGGRVALAPAAVEDCLCALKWVVSNAAKYKFDAHRIVLTGDSAGSHLALTSGMLPASSGLGRLCPGAADLTPAAPPAEPTAAAIVNWYGATDVGELLEGPAAQGFAIAWLGSQLDRAEIARRVSPITYLRPGLPAVLTIHGDADPVVPYSQATRLHAELRKHGVPNKLVTVPGGGHGGFTLAQDQANYAAIREFLAGLKVLP